MLPLDVAKAMWAQRPESLGRVWRAGQVVAVRLWGLDQGRSSGAWFALSKPEASFMHDRGRLRSGRCQVPVPG